MSHPRVSVVVPVYNTATKDLEECISSVLAQSFVDWELCLVDDLSPRNSVRQVLDKAARTDPRIKVSYRSQNGGIVAASNSGLEMARGEFVALLDHDDVIEPDALAEVMALFDSDPLLDYVYTDETLMTAKGEIVERFHKPGWSPERYRHQMYVCHLSVIRRSLVLEVGGFREGFDGSQDYDLMFRVTERARKVGHVPKLLYHWRMVASSVANNSTAKPYAYDAGQRAIESHFERNRVAASVAKLPKYPGNYRVIRETANTVAVDAFVPETGFVSNVWGVERRHSAQTRTELAACNDDRITVKGVPVMNGNRASAFNDVAKDSSADYLLFTSDALEPIGAEWLDELLQPFTDPTVGLVSGTTYCATSRFEHAGYYLNGSFLDKAYYRVKRSERGQRAVLETIREVSAVDWQCLMIRRDVFERVGGFDASLAHPWCVVDLCLQVAGLGYRTVITPRAEFWEFSNADDLAWYRQRAPREFRTRWAGVFANDPYRPKPPRRQSAEAERPFWRPQRLRDFRD